MVDGAELWRNAPHRASMLAVLEAFAEQTLVELRGKTFGGVSGGSNLEVLGAVADGPQLVVHFIFDVTCYHHAQSGSDWDTHHIHLGQAVFKDGVLQSTPTTIEEEIRVAERGGSTDWYDRTLEVARVRATSTLSS